MRFKIQDYGFRFKRKAKTLVDYKISKRKILLIEADSYIGAREEGVNSGPLIEMFQRTIGKAQGESWCMSFVQHCVNKVDRIYSEIDDTVDRNQIFPSEHCLTVFKYTTSRIEIPYPGCIVIWRHGSSSAGHTGIVERVNSDGTLTTIEGNTNGTGSREGDGVYRKIRHMTGDGSLHIVGFLEAWP